jgi:hypothetical protein
MNCSEWSVELVECARRDGNPGRDFGAHLKQCVGCRERWDVERQLTAQLQLVRTKTAMMRSPAVRRELAMRDFGRARNGYSIQKRSAARSWVWALAAAAGLVLAVFIGDEGGLRSRRHTTPVRTNGNPSAETIVYETNFGLSKDASTLTGDDFVAVPYTPPLAPGEIVRVVQTNLSPDALASLGVNVDPLWGSDIQADLVVGEDGLPRAVRIIGNSQ